MVWRNLPQCAHIFWRQTGSTEAAACAFNNFISMGELGEWELKDEALAYQGLESGSACRNCCENRGGCGMRSATPGHWYLVQDTSPEISLKDSCRKPGVSYCLRHRGEVAVAWECFDPCEDPSEPSCRSREGSEEMWEIVDITTGVMRNVLSGKCTSSTVVIGSGRGCKTGLQMVECR
jgi:hypothetical protein